MQILSYVCLGLLAVCSGIHLYHSYKDDTKKRPYTKWTLLLLILGYYLCAAKSPSKLLIAALVTSWLGDILLIPKGMKWFVSGGLSFLASHVLFVCVYVGNVRFENVNFLYVVPVALVYLTVAVLVLKTLVPSTPKSMLVPMFLYIIVNGTMNTFAFMQLISNPSLGSAIAYAGAVLFFVSDCTLYFVRFYKNPDVIFKRHFTVMLTYILGELLITQGILMLAA